MLKFNVITLFPGLFEPHLKNLPFKKALEKKLMDIKLINLRDYALDKRGTVDGKPYGGGTGMILMAEPIYRALATLYGETQNKSSKQNARIILLSPKGRKFDQKMAKDLLHAKDITFICGRYEGIDARVENMVTDIISIGDFVLSGGELPTLVIMESITRLIPGVLEKESATQIESHMNNYLEFPQYTRPKDFRGMKVPSVLLSGNHRDIEKWKKENSTVLV